MIKKQVAANWAASEFGMANFNDKRLTNRLIKLADHFGSTPESPINQSCGTWSETKAAYRFFKNEHVNELEILATHVLNTTTRCEEYETVLSIQDTSYICYQTHDKTTGLGTITKQASNSRCVICLMLTDSLSDQIKTKILEQKNIVIVKAKNKYTIYCKSKKNEEQIIHINIDIKDKELFVILE